MTETSRHTLRQMSLEMLHLSFSMDELEYFFWPKCMLRIPLSEPQYPYATCNDTLALLSTHQIYFLQLKYPYLNQAL
jgi:hypothetical protein